MCLLGRHDVPTILAMSAHLVDLALEESNCCLAASQLG